jgi:hypothetical protein
MVGNRPVTPDSWKTFFDLGVGSEAPETDVLGASGQRYPIIVIQVVDAEPFGAEVDQGFDKLVLRALRKVENLVEQQRPFCFSRPWTISAAGRRRSQTCRGPSQT